MTLCAVHLLNGTDNVTQSFLDKIMYEFIRKFKRRTVFARVAFGFVMLKYGWMVELEQKQRQLQVNTPFRGDFQAGVVRCGGGGGEDDRRNVQR